MLSMIDTKNTTTVNADTTNLKKIGATDTYTVITDKTANTITIEYKDN